MYKRKEKIVSTLKEDHKEVASGKKKDDEGYMANVELDSIERSIKNLRKSIKSSDTQLPAWVQSKITRASDYINTASEYLQSDAKIKEEKTLVQKILEDCGCSHEKCNNTKKGKSCPVHGMKACPTVMEEKDPKGPVQPYKSPEEIAKKHGVSLEAIQKQLKIGIKVEGEHTSDKKAARITALQHLDEVPDYYSKLKKVEKKSTKSESVTIEDANGNKFVEFIDLIKPEPIYPRKQIEEATRINANVGNLVNVILTWRGRNFSLKVFFPQAKLPSRKEIEAEIQKIYPDGRVIYSSICTQEPNQSFLYAGGNYGKPGPNKNYVKPMGEEVEISEAKKSEMKCNKPKAEAHGSGETGKSHVVKACEDGKEKLIRFGQLGVKGSPKKKGESKEYASRRHRFQSRHAKNIAKGKMSAAYWANKVKW